MLFSVLATDDVTIIEIAPLAVANNCDLLLIRKIHQTASRYDCVDDADTFMKVELARMPDHSGHAKGPAIGTIAVLSD